MFDKSRSRIVTLPAPLKRSRKLLRPGRVSRPESRCGVSVFRDALMRGDWIRVIVFSICLISAPPAGHWTANTVRANCAAPKYVPSVASPCNDCNLTESCGSWSYIDSYDTCDSSAVPTGVSCSSDNVAFAIGSCSIDYSSISGYCLVGFFGPAAVACAATCALTTVGWPACFAACLTAAGTAAGGLFLAICECTSGCQQDEGTVYSVPRTVVTADCPISSED